MQDYCPLHLARMAAVQTSNKAIHPLFAICNSFAQLAKLKAAIINQPGF
jgi:hypothetical protein